MAAGISIGALILPNPDAFATGRQIVQNGGGMEAHLFRTAVDTKGHFTIDTTPVLPHMAISLGLMLDFGFHDWIAVEADDPNDTLYPGNGNREYSHTMINTYIDSRLMFNWGLFDYLVLGFQLPIAIPAGEVFSVNPDNPEEVANVGWSTKGGVGDIVFHAKVRFLRADRHPVGVGALLTYQAPVGKNEWLMGEGGGGALAAKLIFDVEPISWYRLALNVGIRAPFGYEKDNYLYNACQPPLDSTADNLREGNCLLVEELDGTQHQVPVYNFGLPGEGALFQADGQPNKILLFHNGPSMTFGLGQSFTLWPEILDFVVEVYGSQLISEFGNMAYFNMEVDAGFKLYIERNSYLMAGYVHGMPASGTGSKYGFQTMEQRAFIGFAFEPSIGDRDADGIKDDVDQCPDDPEDRDDFEDSDGCPDPDNDRDGILDVEDECPIIPEDRDGDQDEDGCPEHGENDRDGDGIVDEKDACPDDPEDFDQFEDADGCPDPDNDKDGIPDVNDMCPNDPEDMDGFEDRNGCPDPDNDADRILDKNDQCPNDPETYNGKDDEDGCPDKGDVVLTDTDIMILKKVYFEYDSAVIKPISYNILDAVAATINNNPQIDFIEVQGHADERGDDKYNLKLTDERAAAVVTYLVNKGVSRNKLRSVGYGEYCPVDDESNEAAWEKNRRVEFKVLSVNGQSTGVRPACDRAQQMGIGVGK
jgi:outer membrane protein OmpA-like peptidoglycan-associated protein